MTALTTRLAGSTGSAGSAGSTEPTEPAGTAAPGATRPAPAPIPLARLARVELRKMFDTRSGFWLMASIGILAVLATAATIVFAPDSAITYESFASAIGFPMAVILPIIAILSVTGEWSQRNGLTTFTLVPSRGRVIWTKALVAVGVAVVSMVVAASIGTLGNLLGSTINGTDPVWDVSAVALAQIFLANVLGLLVGFMLGVVIRSSAPAIVAYFVYSALLPTVLGMLAAFQDWFADLQPWVDFNYAQTALFDDAMTGEQWTQLAVTGVVWLVVPTAYGVWRVLRSEVK
ncbi:ABC transporter permease subunit [Nocardioides marmotae]|uniref:ABC transporter permease subunit n=1 Tax=Nocardioides marmotae TaxID=2663857 RepID=UPI001E653BDA|nr:ABC transporter permease subunit [Nocardioides marmotae]